MLEEIIKRIDSERAALNAGVMSGQFAGDMFQLGMMLGRYQGLGNARNHMLGVNEEEAAKRGDRT